MRFRFHCFISTLLFLAIGSIFSSAQKLPEIDVYGGFSYIRFNSPKIGFSEYSNLTGWEASITAPHLYQALGLTLNGSGDYASPLSVYNFMLGPQLSIERGHLRIFGNVLVGRGETKVTVPQTTRGEISSSGRAVAAGGGVDFNLSHHIAVRLIDADYLYLKTFNTTQNTVRVSAGLVYQFGRK